MRIDKTYVSYADKVRAMRRQYLRDLLANALRSINAGKQDLSARPVATTAMQSRPTEAALKTAMTGAAALGVFVLFCVAGIAYAAFGGAPSNETVSDENVVGRCDKAAVAAADRAHADRSHGRDWRRERQSSFRTCIDAWSSNTQTPRP